MKDITFRKILAGIIIVIFIIIIFSSKSVLEPLILSIVLSYILHPIVKRLVKRGMNRSIASLSIVLGILALFALIIVYVIPGIIKELMGILNNFGAFESFIQRIMDSVGYEKLPQYLKEVVNTTIFKIQGNLSTYLNSLFESIFNFAMKLPTYFLAPIFIYYFLSDKDFFIKKIKFFIPLRFRKKSLELGGHINRVIQGYFLSQVILSIIVSVLTFIALLIIGVKFPLVIAIINGIANFIPYFGPVIGYIPALLFALTQSVNKSIMVTIAFLIIQQVEANIISPKIVSDCTGMHPVEVMIVLLIGGHFFGTIGMVLSVPIAATVKISYKYIVRNMY
ncbi:AI-2E family transporter [Clostridium cylindrosporum]|uniref:Putative permease n=1 Tax=Clostridium cylindrosporum DSM 605 TaxID=1121307 RepID=A0A0J8DAE8_CLOCY|nr:AI-2E family transporter [Clostridium cylindrosporum]KMT21299.1 putative permease [Clostridium cylindrosporum DSM 605]